MHALAAPVLDSPGLQRYGFPELVYGANPAAGAMFSYAVEGAYYERLVTVFCRIVCDANVADREVIVEYRDAGGNRYAIGGAATTIQATETGDYFFSAFLGEDIFTVDGSVCAPLPPLVLPPTHTVRIYVTNIQATDQLSRIRFVRERFYTSPGPAVNGPHPGA